VKGKEAVLTVYDDEKEINEIHLYSLKTIDEMHAKMEELGFHKQQQNKDSSSTTTNTDNNMLRKEELKVDEAQQLLNNYYDYTTNSNFSLLIISTIILIAFAIFYRFCFQFQKKRSGGFLFRRK